MCKKLIVLLFVLAFVGSASAANMYWTAGGGGNSDWSIQASWGGSTALPTSADWVDIRHDSWVAGNGPIVYSGARNASNIRINPGYGTPLRTMEVRVLGGSLTTAQAIYMGSAGGDGLLVLDAGTINVGTYTVVGGGTGNGTLRVNGGTLNAGYLMVPQTWSTVAGGHVAIDGGLINTAGIAIARNGSGTRDIQFTKNSTGASDARIVSIADMNNDNWDSFQAAINANIAANEIFSDVGDITVVYTTTGPGPDDTFARKTEIYSTIPEPMSIALLGFGGLLLRRRRRN